MKIFSFTLSLLWLTMLLFVVMYTMGWLDLGQNATINECLRAGNEWTGNNCK